jgi:hypothetical protein
MSGQYIKTSYDNDPLMYGAFVGCVRWALGNDDIMRLYRDDTGDGFQPAKNGIEKMIDLATGNELAFFQRFSDWVEREIFGSPDQVYDNSHSSADPKPPVEADEKSRDANPLGVSAPSAGQE